MALQYTVIEGNTATTLIAKRSILNTVTGGYDMTLTAEKMITISLCNTHATDSVDVDLYVYDDTLGTFKILNNVKIPEGTTLILERYEISFDNNDYEMKIQLSAADSEVSVIIR